MSTDDAKVLKREDELRDISEIPEVQKGLYAPEKTSLFGKMKENVSGIGSKISHGVDSVKENVLSHHGHEQPEHKEHKTTLFGLINEGLSGLASGISNTIHHVTGTDSKPTLGERTTNLDSGITHVGGIETEVKLAQELETKTEDEAPVKTFGRKMSKAMDDYKDSGVIVHENTITPNKDGPSTLDKINDQYGKAVDKITDAVQNIKEKVLPSGEANTESNITERGEDSDSTVTLNTDDNRETLTKVIEAPTHQINPAELKEFHDVKTGFHESVDEFRHEHRVQELGGKDELVSSNPFDALGKEEEQPLEEKEEPIVEKEQPLGEKALGETTENKPVEQHTGETKSIAQVVKEGLTDATATLSATLGQVVDKGISTLQTPVDKENFRQIA